jgi:hypothetical protein
MPGGRVHCSNGSALDRREGELMNQPQRLAMILIAILAATICSYPISVGAAPRTSASFIGLSPTNVRISNAHAISEARATVTNVSAIQFGPDSIGQEHIVGEVVNNSGTNAQLVQVSFNFYSKKGRLLATDSTFTDIDELVNNERSPYSDIFQPPRGYSHFTITSIGFDRTSSPPNHNFTTKITNTFTDAIGAIHIVGTVKNNGRKAAHDVQLVFDFKNAKNLTVNDDETFVNTPNLSLGGHRTASFEEIYLRDAAPHWTHYALTVQGD